MGTREKDHNAPHQPLLSSLVIRPSDNGVGAAGGAGDYEPGEVRGDALSPYSRSDRFQDDHGGHRFRGFGNGRDPGRYRDYSPPHYSRGRDGARFGGRDYDARGPKLSQGNFRGDGASRNNPNVLPREGDWVCPDPVCKNLNFARREFCNNCKRPRYASGGGSPRRSHLPYPPPPRRFPGPPLPDRSPPPPGRFMNSNRSPPPRVWDRDDDLPRDLRAAYPRREGRLPDPPLRKDRADYPPLDGYEERSRFDRAMPQVDWASRDRGRGGYERRMPSPLFPSSRGQWDREYRDRSRSPVRGGGGGGVVVPPPKDYRRDMYMERGIDDRRGIARGAY